MRFSVLVALLITLDRGLGPPCLETHFQEDCAGDGQLTAGVRVHGLVAKKRDAAHLQFHNCHGTFC